MESSPKPNLETFCFAPKPASNNALAQNYKSIDLVSNFLILNFSQTHKKVWEYYINFSGIEINEYDQTRLLIQKVIPKLKEIFFPFKIAGNNFFSMNFVEQDVTYEFEHLDHPVVATIKRSSHNIDLAKVTTDKKIEKDIKSFFENLLKNMMRANKNMVRLNRTNYFNLQNMEEITRNAFLVNGFSTSFRHTDSGFMLLVNVKNKFLNGMNCYEKIKEIEREVGRGHEFISHLEEFFTGLTVMTKYGAPRVYQLKGINVDYNINNRYIRMHRSGEEISLKRYYELNYPELRIRNENQPLLVVEQKKSDNTTEEIFLIPELCSLTGIDEKTGNEIKQSMTKRTKVRPMEKMRKIEEFINLLNNKDKRKKGTKVDDSYREYSSAQNIKEEWGLSENGFKLLKGKVIPYPMVEFKDGNPDQVRGKISYKELYDKEKCHLGRNDWKIIVSDKNMHYANQFVDSLSRCCGRIGVRVEKPEIERVNSRNADGFVNEMRNMHLNSHLKIILIILDKFSENNYKKIKTYLNTEVGTPSQVVKAENLSKNLSYFTNVLVQMVVKMGGILFKINMTNNLYTSPTVFIGLLIEKHGATDRKIIITCTYDKAFSMYYTCETITKKEDVSKAIIDLMTKAFENFKRKYNIYPSRAFIYRSGVSDNEKKVLFVDEILCIEKYFKSLPSNTLYHYTVVNKKNDVKFFHNQNNNLNNPPDGTVVDEVITSYGSYEFYLQNQFVNQGCATPTHFHVLKSTIGIPKEAFQEITYMMSYYYWNWSGPIRIPACLKFAETYSKFITATEGNRCDLQIKESLRTSPYYI